MLSEKVCVSISIVQSSCHLVKASLAPTSMWRRRESSKLSRREKILADSASERLANSFLKSYFYDLFQVFGELAILYNCKRTASVRAAVDGRVWALERRVFQHIMVTSGIERTENQVSLYLISSKNNSDLAFLIHFFQLIILNSCS